MRSLIRESPLKAGSLGNLGFSGSPRGAAGTALARRGPLTALPEVPQAPRAQRIGPQRQNRLRPERFADLLPQLLGDPSQVNTHTVDRRNVFFGLRPPWLLSCFTPRCGLDSPPKVSQLNDSVPTQSCARDRGGKESCLDANQRNHYSFID